MRRVAFWGTMIVALMTGSLSATEWFVDCTRPDDSGNGKSVEAAKRTIQAAVSAASAGDVVTVLPGVYDEGGNTFTASSVVSSNRVYIMKNLTLRSRDGATSRSARATARPSRTSSARRTSMLRRTPRRGAWAPAPSAASRWRLASPT